MSTAEGPVAPGGRVRAAAPFLAVALIALAHQALALEPELWAGPSDAAKYLTCARAAPAHRLYDDHLYVMHPPLFPYLIRATSALTWSALPTAATLLSSLATVALIALVQAAARALTGSVTAGVAAGLTLAVSRGAIYCGQGTYREPVQTLLLLVLLAVAMPRDESAARRPGRVALAAALALALGLLWDPLVLLAPGLALAAWFPGRRPALLAAALALALGWGGWAAVRAAALAREPLYPAGIDGMIEETAGAGPKALFNPNFFPRTARHNAYYWPAELTPGRPLGFAAPWFTQDEGPFLEAPPTAGQSAAAALLGLAALLGAAALTRRPPERDLARPALVALCALAFLGGPGALGRTARYGYALLPVLGVLVGAAAGALARRVGRDHAVAAAVVALGAASAVAWAATGHRHASWARPQRFEGRGVARWLEGLDGTPAAGPWAIAVPVGLTPDQCWLLPGRRVVTLPFTAEGTFELLERRDARLVVLPHEVSPWVRPGTTQAEAELAAGVPMVRVVHEAARAGALTHLGVVVEAEVTDRARARAFDLFWRPVPGAPAPAPFGAFIEPGCLAALRRALIEGALSPGERRALASAGPALARRVDDPVEGPDARALLAALGR